MSFSHVVLVGIDGLGGWYLQQLGESMPTKIPHLSQMLRPTGNGEGNNACEKTLCTHSALVARAAFPPVSGPAWTTMLTGDTVAHHGVDSNDWPTRPGKKQNEADSLTQFPCNVTPLRSKAVRGDAVFSVCGRRPWTVVDELVAAGRTAHIAVAWSWLTRLFNNVSIDASNSNENKGKREKDTLSNETKDTAVVKVINGAGDDAKCVAATCAALGQFDFSFLHLDMVDHAGHAHGWGSPLYLEAVTAADAEIGRIVEAATKTQKSVLIIVCSDHGGTGHSHGAMQKNDMLVPLILWATNANEDLNESHEHMTVMDIAPTVLTALGVTPPRWMSGVSRAPCKTRDVTKQ